MASVHEGFAVWHHELHVTACSLFVRERANHTLQPTALLNEALVKLSRSKRFEFRGRDQFLEFVSTTMKHILVDYAKRRRRQKNSASGVRVPLDSVDAPSNDFHYEHIVLEIDDALSRLWATLPSAARVAELRMVRGLEIKEIGPLVGLSRTAVYREWTTAEALLTKYLREGDAALGSS